MYKLRLYDSKGHLKCAEIYTTEHLAWASGKDWESLTRGNFYMIEKDLPW